VGINELDTNPLEASLNIKANDPANTGNRNYLSSPNRRNISTRELHADQNVIERLRRYHDVERGGWVITLFLALIAGLVVFNTIRLAIYSNRDEIGIMRVVGAQIAGSRTVRCGRHALRRNCSCLELGSYCSGALLRLPVFESSSLDRSFHYFYSHLVTLLLYELLFGTVHRRFSSFFRPPLLKELDCQLRRLKTPPGAFLIFSS